MQEQSPAKPLYDLIGRIRKPASIRELIALCLRSIYMGNQLTCEDNVIPDPPKVMLDEVSVVEELAGGIRCAIYSPKSRTHPLPVILYMHGGGFVIGCSEDTDYVTRLLCWQNQTVVISINYRLAPETPFPGAISDCEQVFKWVVNESQRLGINPECIYLAGDSAGGNLAMALPQRLVEHRALIKGLILLAPWLDMQVEQYASYNKLAPGGIVFDAPFIGYARASYALFEQWQDPLASPILSCLVDLPPTILAIGSADPLVDQALCLKESAIRSGCQQIEVLVYPEMPHCFYSFPGLFAEERDCFDRIANFISRTLS